MIERNTVVAVYVNKDGNVVHILAREVANDEGYISHQLVFEYVMFTGYPKDITYAPVIIALEGKGIYIK